MTIEGWTPEQVKEYIAALLVEKDKAVAMADEERHLSAIALETARSDAAKNLRIELARATSEGDDRLREHISNQIMQIQSALDSAQRATDKFEQTVKDQFVQVKDLTIALDELGKTMATRRELETAIASIQATNAELAKQVQELRSRLDVGPTELQALRSRIDLSTGQEAGARLTYGNMAALIAVAATVIGIIVVATNWLSGP